MRVLDFAGCGVDNVRMHRIGIEIGGTKLQAAVGTDAGAIEHRIASHVPEPRTSETILQWVEAVVPELQLWAETNGEALSGLGVGFGGPVDSASGRVLTSHQVEGWDGVALRPWFEERFNLPTTIVNDSNAAGWAEYVVGAGKGTQTFCYMNIGSGIGGALVIDERLHDGQGRGAFEMGHIHVPNPFAEMPGAVDTLENLFSGWSIERRARESLRLVSHTPLWELTHARDEEITCERIGKAAAEGDEAALGIVRGIAETVGVAMNNAITLVHPEVFAIGGGVSLMGEVLLEPIRERIAELAYVPYGGGTNVVCAELGEDVVLVGALLLAP